MVLEFIKNQRSKLVLSATCLFIVLIIAGCSEDSGPAVNNYNSTGKSALIIAVENNDGLLNGESELAFQMYKEEMLSIFTEIFGVNKSEMDGMSLNGIIEKYGEVWQINHIKDFAKSHYDTIITMRNEEATSTNLRNHLVNLNNSDYTIDMVFCLHGSENIVSFYDHEYVDIQEFATFISSNNINLRMLYQTCCTAGKALTKWQSSGIYGVNGAIGINNITLFSPGFFMEEWVNGKDFETSVNLAFQRDIEKTGSYNDRVPIKQFILTDENVTNSKQLIGGRNKKIKISDYLKTETL